MSIEDRLAVAKGEGMGEEMDWEVGLPDVSFVCRMDKQQGPAV